MSQDQRTRKRAVRPSQGATAKTSSPIPGAGGAADRGAPASEADPKLEARAASPNPTEDLPQSPAAIGAILNDLHKFIAHGELILRELASNPNFLAPTPGVIKLEEWLSYLTSRVFPELGPFQSSGGTIAVKPPDFDHGPWLSVIHRYLDCQAVREALQRLQSHLIELNKLDPIRPAPRPHTLNRRRPSPLDDAGESWEKQMRLDEEVARKREALGRDIVTEFDTFLESSRSLRGQLAVRLLDVEEPPRQDLPEWDKENLRLRWKGEVVRTVRCDAAVIIVILDSFQELEWRLRIPNPLTGPPENREEKLNSAIDSLNRKLKMLRFHTEKNCTEIWWEPIQRD
jgi:hypothetical protein